MTLLHAESLVAGYGPVTVLRDVSVDVDDGELVVLLGPNGAGKTTLLRALTGLVPVVGGSVTLDGETITNIPAHRAAGRGIAHVLENRGIFEPLTVEQNLTLGAVADSSGPRSRQEQADRVYELFPVLAQRRRQRAGTLSGGEQKMLAIGRALMGRPRVLLLDEPSAGLAPRLVERVYEAVVRLNADGLAVLVVEQNVRVALAVAQRAYVLAAGRIELEGAAEELLDDRRVQALYLGGVEDSATAIPTPPDAADAAAPYAAAAPPAPSAPHAASTAKTAKRGNSS